MTSRDHARRVTAEMRARLSADRPESTPAGPSLPDRLAAARERKGVDLMRAERDTKIRARYLGALERGDYRDLPGAVYTKGFLRNYAIYLGLDPDDVLRQWRRERGEHGTTEPLVVPPGPISPPPRPLTFSPSVVVAALMTLGVVVFGIYLAVQLLRYARPPDLAVTKPPVAVVQVEDGVTTYQLEGTSTAGATIEVSAPGRDQPYRTTALGDGTWSVQVDLRRGRNEFEVSAKNPDTGKVTDTPRTIVITVPFLVIEAPTLTVSQPVDGTTYENGAIPVEGIATNAASVTVLSIYLGPPGSTATPAPPPSDAPSTPPGASPPGASPRASGEPPGTTVQLDADGTFSTPLELTEGRWAITITATSDGGKTASLTRTVTVAYQGVTVVVRISGGSAWIKVWIDGVLASGYLHGQTYRSGKTLTFTGSKSVEVLTGSSGNTSFTVNGVELGTLGKAGIPETWLFAPPDPPKQTNRR